MRKWYVAYYVRPVEYKIKFLYFFRITKIDTVGWEYTEEIQANLDAWALRYFKRKYKKNLINVGLFYPNRVNKNEKPGTICLELYRKYVKV